MMWGGRAPTTPRQTVPTPTLYAESVETGEVLVGDLETVLGVVGATLVESPGYVWILSTAPER